MHRRWQYAGAVGVSALIFWGVWVTAWSHTPTQALQALEETLALEALEWELGPLIVQDDLDPVVAMTIGQSALLSAARTEVADLWRSQEQDNVAESEVIPQQEEKTPVVETPIEPQAPTEEVAITPVVDNGMPARTLVATSSANYIVCDNVYISNSSDLSVTPEQAMAPFAATLTGEEPQILIIHTHGTEAYTPAEAAVDYSSYMRTLDAQYSVIAAGDVMAQTLGELGISVLHDRTAYDYPSYADSYDLSLAAMEQYLQDYPSIQFVIDVHRDAIEDSDGNQYKLVTTLDDGRTAAQISLVVGSSGGGLYHPDWLENLRLSVAVGNTLTTMNDTIFRPILLRNSRYNQHVSTGAMLVEIGAAGNSPEEATLAAELFATALAQTLFTQ